AEERLYPLLVIVPISRRFRIVTAGQGHACRYLDWQAGGARRRYRRLQSFVRSDAPKEQGVAGGLLPEGVPGQVQAVVDGACPAGPGRWFALRMADRNERHVRKVAQSFDLLRQVQPAVERGHQV